MEGENGLGKSSSVRPGLSEVIGCQNKTLSLLPHKYILMGGEKTENIKPDRKTRERGLEYRGFQGKTPPPKNNYVYANSQGSVFSSVVSGSCGHCIVTLQPPLSLQCQSGAACNVGETNYCVISTLIVGTHIDIGPLLHANTGGD